MASPHFDVLSTTATELQQLLAASKITSVQIVQEYFSQIDRHEPTLNAFISEAPRDKVLRAAALLDKERQEGQLRSTLHGIPIVIKDCFTTASKLGMSTTCGAVALVGSIANKNAAIVDRLLDAGLIILAKTNMTEFCGMKMTMMMPGWSAHGGQTQSPYVKVIEENEKILGHSSPGGSSTGSGVAVSAGFSPLAMGTETIGSIITPAIRNALYALKPTIGIQDTTGLFTMTDFYDSAGPLAKSPADVLALTEVLLGQDYSSTKTDLASDISVGFVDPKLWTLPEELCVQHEDSADQMVEDFINVSETLKNHGCTVKYPVHVPDTSVLLHVTDLAHWEFKHLALPRFFKSFSYCPVNSIEELVAFNENNKEKAMPHPYTEQNDLIKSMNTNTTPEEMEVQKTELRKKARDILHTVFEENEVNLLVGPVDSGFCIHACAAGYPVATIPIGQLRYNGRPFGACVVARGGDEASLLRFQAAHEAACKPRPTPTL